MAKAKKKQALGRGLSALLKEPEQHVQSVEDKGSEKVVGNILEIKLSAIEVNPFQPRLNFNEETLNELATSIKELGIIQPITVRKIGLDKYQLVSGERRYRASKLVGLETIPAYVRIANDQESLEMALVENIQRQDLDPIEVALSYQRLIDEIELTQEEMSQRVGKKRSTIANYLRLLKLDPIVQNGMRDGFLGMGHGRALVNVEDLEDQIAIYERIITNGLSVRDTEKLVKTYKEGLEEEKKSEIPAYKSIDYTADSVDGFQDFFDTKVAIKVGSNGKGKITIPFGSEIEFKRIKKLLNLEE